MAVHHIPGFHKIWASSSLLKLVLFKPTCNMVTRIGTDKWYIKIISIFSTVEDPTNKHFVKNYDYRADSWGSAAHIDIRIT